MTQLGFLAAEVWLDEDDRHVWLAHDCGEAGHVETMLPDIWKADTSGRVTPSINCGACGLHYFATVSALLNDET